VRLNPQEPTQQPAAADVGAGGAVALSGVGGRMQTFFDELDGVWLSLKRMLNLVLRVLARVCECVVCVCVLCACVAMLMIRPHPDLPAVQAKASLRADALKATMPAGDAGVGMRGSQRRPGNEVRGCKCAVHVMMTVLRCCFSVA